MQTLKVPKVHHLLIRTHRLTILVTVLPTATISSVKNEVLSALTSGLHDEQFGEIKDMDQFELCKKQRTGRGEYEMLDATQKIKDAKLNGWEVIYVQWRDSSGVLQPINATDPPIDDDEDASSTLPPPDEVRRDNKGKRKATEVDEEDFFDVE
ncbi:hypothetical protein Moror_14914 [Moniliophthora roreri MCA 2997]|uniref:Uncharacterized protein n=1 Tax=Moniliophthora roreri (strain MCA 2997) TaxID=1381753 RepID=V2WDI0_MONRO|nr:hypothetical protein Moror_14914 [Moniliophthora roreri MCA 2997]